MELIPQFFPHFCVERGARDSLNRRLSGAIDVGHEYEISLAKTMAKLMEKIAHSGEAMRLKNDNQPPLSRLLAERGNRRCDLGGMMPIVVVQLNFKSFSFLFQSSRRPPKFPK